jgi:hypothetical protein
MADEPTALSGVARAGDRLETLRALRDRLAAEIDVCDSKRDVAALSQRLMDVLEQIEAAEKARPESKGTPLDELAARRKRPAAGATRASRAK